MRIFRTSSVALWLGLGFFFLGIALLGQFVKADEKTGSPTQTAAAVSVVQNQAPAQAPAANTKPVRIVGYLSSADYVLSSLRYIVVDLGKEKIQWDKNIEPNIQTFLNGVDPTLPIRSDILLDGTTGKRKQLVVPVKNVKAFISDNLDPLGITVKKVAGDKDFYKLTGAYVGFMRYLSKVGYAVISEKAEDLSADMVDPTLAHLLLQKSRAGMGLSLVNLPEDALSRELAFKKIRENVEAGLKKRTQETQNEFALRKQTALQHVSNMQSILFDASELRVTLDVDQTTGIGKSQLILAATQNTTLASFLKSIGESQSLFANIPKAPDAILNMRVKFPLDDHLKQNLKETYKLSRPVSKENIDAQAKGTPTEKEARKQMAEQIQDMLANSVDLGLVDICLEVVPTEKGLHRLLLGMSSADNAPIEKILKLLPKAEEGWTTKVDFEKEGDVAFHTVTPKEIGKSLKEFYGPAGVLYIATTPKSLWFATGEGSLPALKTAIKQAAEPAPKEISPHCLSLHMHAHPVLKNWTEFLKEENFDLISRLRKKGMFEKVDKETEKKEVQGKKAEKKTNNVDALKNFKWEDDAIAALLGTDDLVDVELKLENGQLHGISEAHSGLLKALGRLIGKFARENLQ